MGDRAQQSASDESKQTTPKGLEIPVPKRRDVLDALRKVVGMDGHRCHVCGERVSGTSWVRATVEVDGKRRSAVVHEACL